MNQAQVLEQLRGLRAELAEMGVQSLSVFGSLARHEAMTDSDVDLLIEFNSAVGLFEYFAVKERLEEALGVRVDLVTSGGLKPRIKEQVLSEAISAN